MQGALCFDKASCDRHTLIVDRRDQTEAYDPNGLIDALRLRLGAKNDASLARRLQVGREVISKIRHGRRRIGAGLLLRMHEITGLSVADLRDLLRTNRNVL